MAVHTVKEVRPDGDFVRQMFRGTQQGPVYIRLDRDVLNPSDILNTSLLIGGGLRCEEVWDILIVFANRLVGSGVYEYAPSRSKSAFMEKLIHSGLLL